MALKIRSAKVLNEHTIRLQEDKKNLSKDLGKIINDINELIVKRDAIQAVINEIDSTISDITTDTK